MTNEPKNLEKNLEVVPLGTIKVGWVNNTAGFNKLYCKRGITYDALARRMLDQIDYSLAQVSEIKLGYITPSMLGLKDGWSFSEFIEKAQQAGLEICATDDGPYLAMEFPFKDKENTDTYEYLYMAMKPLYDSQHKKNFIFNIEKAPIFNELSLGASMVGINEKEFDKNSRFVFRLPREKGEFRMS